MCTYKIAFYKTLALLVLLTKGAMAQEVVLAFDKTLAPSASLDGMARSKMLVNNMAKGDVTQAMFLIRTNKINAKTEERVAFYDNAGQLLVNAGDSLTPYHRAKNYAYPIDLMKANAKLLPYVNYHQHIFLPMLVNGKDENLLSQLRDFLSEHGYQRTYVTYAANDDYLDHLYQLRVLENRPVDMRKVEQVFVKMLMDKVNDYDAKARVLLGYSPRQVILLHETDVTAYCILGFIDALNARGYKVVAPEKVFADPVANPFYWNGYSATGYMQAVTNLPDAPGDDLFIPLKSDDENIHRYLRAQGLENLIP